MKIFVIRVATFRLIEAVLNRMRSGFDRSTEMMITERVATTPQLLLVILLLTNNPDAWWNTGPVYVATVSDGTDHQLPIHTLSTVTYHVTIS
jgi:hypothetical protein